MFKSFMVKALARFDSWANAVTGQGTSLDKSTYGAFHLPEYFTAYDLFEELYVADPIFGRIATARPKDAFRAGYDLEGDDASAMTDLRKVADALGSEDPEAPRLDAAVQEAWSLANAMGGAAIIIRTRNEVVGTELGAEEVTGFTVVSRREIQPEWIVDGLLTGAQRRTEFYILNSVRIHKSRVVAFYGEPAPRRYRIILNGWGVSKFVKPYRIVSMFMQGIGAMGGLLTDTAQGVWLIGGLWQMLAQDDTGAADSLSKRTALYDLNRSSGRALMLDKDTEDFKRVATPLTGVPETLQELRSVVALAADMPETRLFMRSPAGMNATGESDSRNWYDTVDAERRSDISPRMLRIYQAIARGIGKKEPSGIAWGALYGMSAKEHAEVDKLRQETVTIAIDNGTLSTDEARLGLVRGESLYAVVNEEEAAQEVEAARKPISFGERSEDDEPEGEDKEGATVAKADKVTIPLTPTDVAEVVRVNEARASLDLPALDGTEGAEFIGAFKVRQQAKTAAAVALEFPGATIETESATTKGKGVPAAPAPSFGAAPPKPEAAKPEGEDAPAPPFPPKPEGGA